MTQFRICIIQNICRFPGFFNDFYDKLVTLGKLYGWHESDPLYVIVNTLKVLSFPLSVLCIWLNDALTDKVRPFWSPSVSNLVI